MDKRLKEINQKICKVMEHETTIKYNVVDEIEPSPSGKYNYAFSNIKKT